MAVPVLIEAPEEVGHYLTFLLNYYDFLKSLLLLIVGGFDSVASIMVLLYELSHLEAIISSKDASLL